MNTVEKLIGRVPGDMVLDIHSPCPSVGILSMRRTVDLVSFGEELGLSPVPHNAEGDIVWEVKAKAAAAPGIPRSHTAEEFVWHTDASFEELPPRYFMLQVLHGDRYGGGHQNFIPLNRLLAQLDDEDEEVLKNANYRWNVPVEFQKESEQAELPIIFEEPDGGGIRYRYECLSTGGLDLERRNALNGLRKAIEATVPISHIPRAGELVLVDNWQALHSREHIKDPERHLQRVRFS